MCKRITLKEAMVKHEDWYTINRDNPSYFFKLNRFVRCDPFDTNGIHHHIIAFRGEGGKVSRARWVGVKNKKGLYRLDARSIRYMKRVSINENE